MPRGKKFTAEQVIGKLGEAEVGLARRPIPSTKKAKPELVAKFTINAIPTLAVLDRGGTGTRDGAAADPWDTVCHRSQAPMGSEAAPRTLAVSLTRKCHRATLDVPVMPPADSRPPQAS
jgi:hypothetical protein